MFGEEYDKQSGVPETESKYLLILGLQQWQKFSWIGIIDQ
jgi:hypothetical protein